LRQKNTSRERIIDSTMGQASSTQVTSAPSPPQPASEKPPKKLGIKTGKPICCCCPDTKKPRDECVLFRGEEDPECQKLIEAHKLCLREEGFDVK